MNAAELILAREYMGLSLRWMADWLDVNERQYRRWEQNEDEIPSGVAESVESLAIITERVVRDFIADPRSVTPGHVWVTYRTDGDMKEANAAIAFAPHAVDSRVVMRFPASWHRATVARAHNEVGGAVVYYVPIDERT